MGKTTTTSASRMPSATPTGRAEGAGQSSGGLQTVWTERASEQAEGAMRFGRKADHGSRDRSGEAEVALPDVDRPGQVLDVAQVGVRDLVDMQAALPEGGRGMLTLDGYMHGSGGADGVADGEADGGMPKVCGGARDRPMAETRDDDVRDTGRRNGVKNSVCRTLGGGGFGPTFL